jgi:hypothetical protein
MVAASALSGCAVGWADCKGQVGECQLWTARLMTDVTYRVEVTPDGRTMTFTSSPYDLQLDSVAQAIGNAMKGPAP